MRLVFYTTSLDLPEGHKNDSRKFWLWELAAWAPAEGLQLQLGTWSLLAPALMLRVVGLSGLMGSRPPQGTLIMALTLSVGQGLGGVHLRSKGKFSRKEAQRGRWDLKPSSLAQGPGEGQRAIKGRGRLGSS